MPLDTASSRRRWYPPAIVPLPPEPGRLVVCALLGRARVTRGCSTPGDDGLETRVYAVKRYLFRLGHTSRSARYATPIAQLVVGLAPVMGWGPVPRGGAARARFVRAHRRSVQRWLDDLQAAGLVLHEPERDDGGRWWRTQIVLQRAPEQAAHELDAARQRPGAGVHASGLAVDSPDAGRRSARSATAAPSRSLAPERAWRLRVALTSTNAAAARKPSRR